MCPIAIHFAQCGHHRVHHGTGAFRRWRFRQFDECAVERAAQALVNPALAFFRSAGSESRKTKARLSAAANAASAPLATGTTDASRDSNVFSLVVWRSTKRRNSRMPASTPRCRTAAAKAGAVIAPRPRTSARPLLKSAETSGKLIGRSHTGSQTSPTQRLVSAAASGAAPVVTNGNAPVARRNRPNWREGLPRNSGKASQANAIAQGVTCPSRNGRAVPLLNALLAALNQQPAL
jgi:hypothetical protein